MSVVYFVAGGAHIKIGTSTNFKSRLASLQTSTVEELTLIGTIPGDAELERQIHARLERYRKRGEWFLDCAEVRSHIIELCGSDVFATVEKEPEPEPLGDIRVKLAEMALAAKLRLVEFSNRCFDGVERNPNSRLRKVHVTKRYMIIAVISHAARSMERDSDAFELDQDDQIDAVGRMIANIEMCEAQVEIILGDDVWFLDGWERKPRQNPLFETVGGKQRWNTKQEAVADGWVDPPDGFLHQILPWFKSEMENAA